MEKRLFVWSTVDASKKYIPFIVIEADGETARELTERKGEQLWLFIANKLEGTTIIKNGREIEIPPYFNEYKRKNLFWYNNVLEAYEEAYERLKEEIKEQLEDYYDDD